MTAGRACTIVLPDSVAEARVLASSLADDGGGYELTALVVGDPGGGPAGGEPFEVVGIDEIALSVESVHRLMMLHEPRELMAALKPHLLDLLLGRDIPELLYLDPAVQVYGSLAAVFEQIARDGMVVWPKTLRPVPDDGLEPSGRALWRDGVFDGGAIGVGAAAREFVRAWAAEARREQAIDPDGSTHPDKWLDLAPAQCGASIARDPQCDVAYWNVHERSLEGDAPDRVTVDGHALRFIQFRGFDPDRPYLLTTEVTDLARVEAVDDPVLRGLCEDRARRLREASANLSPHALGDLDTLSNGLHLDADIRRLWHSELTESVAARREPPPDPFAAGGDAALERWLNERIGGDPSTPISRYVYWTWRSRPDLQATYPDPLGDDATGLFTWAHEAEDFVGRVQPRLLPRASTARVVEERIRPGYNLVGFLEAEFGLGDIARSIASAVSASGIPLATLSIRAWTQARQQAAFRSAGDGGLTYGVNLLTIMANETVIASRDPAMRWVLEDRHNVGMWFWEVDRLSDATAEGLGLVDEVWVASDYMAGIFEAAGTVPVHKYVLPVSIPTGPTHLTKVDLGLPEGYLFGFVFDFLSVVERKNPLGLVEAYTSAFAPGDGMNLVIKSVNGGRSRAQWARLRDVVADRPDIVLIDGFMNQAELSALFQCIDCYVSLHRSEGFGATMATAMASSKPTIATGFSGNLDFMNDGNSYLVPYELVEVGPHAHPYPAGAMWAAPDLGAAAELMRRVVDDPDEAEARGRRAREELRESHSLERSAAFFAQQFERIYFDG